MQVSRSGPHSKLPQLKSQIQHTHLGSLSKMEKPVDPHLMVKVSAALVLDAQTLHELQNSHQTRVYLKRCSANYYKAVHNTSISFLLL